MRQLFADDLLHGWDVPQDQQKYKLLYFAQFLFRHDNLGNEDIFDTAMKGC